MVTYENQRFYTLIGWSPNTLIGERDNWSDIDGSKGNFKREDFKLPDNTWKWDGEWNFLTENTDASGFQYAFDFNMTYRKEKTLKDFVRRR